ncbi:50S ribosomal protein L31e [Candidatus Woesearchaeota archaeon]|nr:50S ribosomal protein L31e [Candidatus Woesearchaeota archaeon]
MAEKTAKAAAVERTLTINIRKSVIMVPRYRRAKKAVTAVREFLQRHMKAPAENVKLGKYLNLKLWERGIQNPLTRLTVVARKDDKGIVTAELPNIPVKKQKLVKEKQGKKAAALEAKKAETATEPEKAAQTAPKAESQSATIAKNAPANGK